MENIDKSAREFATKTLKCENCIEYISGICAEDCKCKKFTDIVATYIAGAKDQQAKLAKSISSYIDDILVELGYVSKHIKE